MPSIHAQVDHGLSPLEARSRMARLASSLQQLFPTQVRNVASQWDGNVLSLDFDTYGFRVAWEITVGEKLVDIRGVIPVSARMFEQKIEQTIVRRIEAVLEEADQCGHRAAA